MKPERLKTAVTYLAGWGIAVFFVTLLSFIFSFLGTIFCAAVAGMMLGATRQARVLALPTSLIFPGVIFALLRGMKSDLPSNQVVELAAACFGAFWVIFGIAAVIVACERKGVDAPGGTKAARRTPAAKMTPVLVNASRVADPTQLEGRWLEEAAGTTLQASTKVLEIRRGRLELSQIGKDGRERLLVRGQVKLDPFDSVHGWKQNGEWNGAADWVVI